MFQKILIVILFILGFSMMPLHAQQVTQGELLIDVRSPQEFAQRNLRGAINIEYQNIVQGVEAMNIQYDVPIRLYCRSGARASVALQALKDAGYTNVKNLGGLEELIRAGYFVGNVD